jgi:hypothetical protein
VDQPQRNSRQIIVAEKGADPLPGDDEDQQQRYAVDQVQITGQRRRLPAYAAGLTQFIDKVLQNSGHHRLRRGEDHVAQQADREHAEKGPQIAEQAKIDS